MRSLGAREARGVCREVQGYQSLGWRRFTPNDIVVLTSAAFGEILGRAERLAACVKWLAEV